MKALGSIPAAILALLTQHVFAGSRSIDREQVVSRFNPQRHANSGETPMQVGNGNFAFGADITGLQTISPFGTLSSWGWHNISLPDVAGQTSPEDFTGLDWWTHGRLVNYAQPNPAEANISQWLISNPHRINLVRIGFMYEDRNITEDDLSDTVQTLDLLKGEIYSQFTLDGEKVEVWTTVDPVSDTIAVEICSAHLAGKGGLSVFFDYPYATGESKFEAPFVGIWDAVSNHTTTLRSERRRSHAQIRHDLDDTTYFTTINWHRKGGEIKRLDPSSHRYVLQPPRDSSFKFTATLSPSPRGHGQRVEKVREASGKWWQEYWNRGAFVQLSSGQDARADELERRIILSQYLMAVNCAGNDPPQESGLVNNGWYGKFHLEMYLWHTLHWPRWDRNDMLLRSLDVYGRFLPTSIERAHNQGYQGARWGKMSDPTGRSAPGEINSLLIWQQPHILYFAETEYQRHPSGKTLHKWDRLLTQSANFMASYAFWNESTGVYDLGPPMYPASENTNPNTTVNPTFELAYWRFGLDIAMKWKERQNLPVPEAWSHVADNLAPLPVSNGLYDLYEGIPGMWKPNSTTVSDHPALTAILGLLPPTEGVNETTMANTVAKIAEVWDWDSCWGWDFPMLAMNAVRLGHPDRAVDWLLHENFAFDDVGMPIGGKRVPTPYFPASGSLLLSVALMAGGWTGDERPKFPDGWDVKVEGFMVAL